MVEEIDGARVRGWFGRVRGNDGEEGDKGEGLSALDLARPDIFALTLIGLRPAGEGNLVVL